MLVRFILTIMVVISWPYLSVGQYDVPRESIITLRVSDQGEYQWRATDLDTGTFDQICTSGNYDDYPLFGVWDTTATASPAVLKRNRHGFEFVSRNNPENRTMVKPGNIFDIFTADMNGDHVDELIFISRPFNKTILWKFLS